jgi:hypothetical protein
MVAGGGAEPRSDAEALDLRVSSIILKGAMTIPDLNHYLVQSNLPDASLVPAGAQLGPVHELLAAGFAEAGRRWADLKQQRDAFDQLYRETEEGAAAPEVIRVLAEEIEEHERRLAAENLPGLQQIAGRLPHYYRRKKRDRNAQSMARLGEEIIAIGTAWLELVQNTRLRLLRLASIRDGEPPSPTFADADAAIEDLRRALAG